MPLALLGLAPQPGVSYKADFGILTADASGVATQVRSYWANPATGVVSGHFEMLGPETHDPRAVLLEVVNDFRHACGSCWTANAPARWK